MAQRDFGACQWEVADAVEDHVLAAQGWKLAGPGRDASDLSPEERSELFTYLTTSVGFLDKTERARESELLERCPFFTWIPPIDLDVASDVPKSTTLMVAQRVNEAARRRGLLPLWFTTGGSGLHGDMRTTKRHRMLMAWYLAEIRAVANACGVALLSSYRKTAGRPEIVIDDTLFERDPGKRGVLWRLAGSTRREGGTKALLQHKWSDDPLPTSPVPDRETADDKGALMRLDGRRESERVQRDERAKRRALRPKAVPLVELTGRLLDNFSKSVAAVLPGEGSRHFVRMALAGYLMQAGVPESVAETTLVVSTDDPQDAVKAVRSTYQQDPDTVTGYKYLRKELGPKAARQLAMALGQDLTVAGIQPGETAVALASASDSTSFGRSREDRYFFDLLTGLAQEEKRPSANALRGAASCGDYINVLSCGLHGDRRHTPVVCRREIACTYCREVRAKLYKAFLEETWPDCYVAIMDAPMIPEKPDADAVERTKYARQARWAIGRSTPKRWVMGHLKVAVFIPKTHDGMDCRSALGVWCNDAMVPLDIRECTGPEAAEIAVDMILSIGQEFDRVVAERDGLAIVRFPWLKPHAKRTSANRPGLATFPWPTPDRLNEMAVEQAREKEGLDETADLTKCNQIHMTQDGQLTNCRRTLNTDLIHKWSGRVLARNSVGKVYSFAKADEYARQSLPLHLLVPSPAFVAKLQQERAAHGLVPL